eukprot:SAG31_NODE_71_length_28115_cov_4.128105_11_plen_54_part_00
MPERDVAAGAAEEERAAEAPPVRQRVQVLRPAVPVLGGDGVPCPHCHHCFHFM